MCKLNESVTELSLYDIVNAPGVSTDLSHINTPAVVKGYQPKDKEDQEAIKLAFTGADIVIIPAGIPRKPGMTRADLFKINAGIVRSLVTGVAKYCPKAALLIISNPVNATVVIAAEELKKYGVFDPAKLFGVTTLDSVRAETFLGELLKVPASKLRGEITVVGGHSGDTIVPLLNVNKDVGAKVAKMSSETLAAYVNRVQYGGDEVVKAKAGKGSATLSMALAGYRFAQLIIDSIEGNSVSRSNNLPDAAYVYLPGIPGGEALVKKFGVEYFAAPVVLGKGGKIAKVLDVFGSLSDLETKLINVAIDGLKASISQGSLFVNGSPKL